MIIGIFMPLILNILDSTRPLMWLISIYKSKVALI